MQNNTDNSFDYNKLPRSGTSNTMHDVQAFDPYRQAEQMRVMPRQLSTGAQKGEMTVFGKIIVGNPNNNERIIIGTNGDDFGFFGAESNGGDEANLDIAWKIVGQTFYFYDIDDDGRNIMQVGKLPDGTFNMVAAKDGYEVEDAF